jgi:2-polyprenyl-6-methoxyphenol hydroxylase-like FAD-dependent oxidoreductase/molybdopterin converting factor small subunit
MQVTVVGGGVSGLGTALALARDGLDVEVLERDRTPMPTSADEAFDWDRRGAPQVRHSHAFLARLRNTLRDAYPDIYAALLAEGATELRFGDDLPPTIQDFVREDGDDDLVMLACRRTTFEWQLRKAALDEGRVTFRVGVAAEGVTATGDPEMPTITGLRLSDGTTLDTSLVVVAGGRRSTVPDWLTAVGAHEVPEQVEDTGIVYYSRFYRLNDGAEYPARTGPIGGDLGYVKYGVFVGDNRTFSITLATPTADEELRKALADPVAFDEAARHLVATAPYLDGRSTPLTPDVHVMAGLLNRWRDFVVDGRPVALGLHVIGDARVCTNPLYGRGLRHRVLAGTSAGRHVARAPDRPARPGTPPRPVDPRRDPSLVPRGTGTGHRGAPGGRCAAGRRGPRWRCLRPPHLHAGRLSRRAAPGDAHRRGRAASVLPQPEPAHPTRVPGHRPRRGRSGAGGVAGPREPPTRAAARPALARRLHLAVARCLTRPATRHRWWVFPTRSVVFRAMAVTVRIPTTLRPLSGGNATVEIEAGTLGEVLARLDAAHPGFHDRLFDDAGAQRRFVNLFVADDDVRYLQGLDTPVPDGETVSIIPAVAGG